MEKLLELNDKLQNKKIQTKTGLIILLIVAFSVISLLFKFNIIGLIKDLFMLKYLPVLGSDASLGLLFVFGILTSFHCMGMCGGIAISQTVKKAGNESSQKRNLILPSFLYNFGRISSYTIIGGVVGGLGQVISFTGIWRSIVPVIGGTFMIIMAINLFGIFRSLRYLNIRMPSIFAKKVFSGKHYGPLVVGLLSGLMPCGPLQMIQIYALGTKSILYGAVSMFVFSIGTVPLLFLFGVLNTFINHKHSKLILRASALLVLILGFVMIGRGLALAGVNLDLNKLINNKVVATENNAVAKGNIQILETSITSNSFPSITVQRGIPVKWNLHADKDNLNDCNNAIVIPKLKIEKKLHVGDNYINFTPTESGTIIYTCWMGMIKSRIVVLDSLN